MAQPLLSPPLSDKREALRGLLTSFCDARLTAEYKKLSLKLLDTWIKVDSDAVLRCKEGIAAAAVLHTLGSLNGLFYGERGKRVSAQEIAAAFGVSTGGVSTRVNAIRDALQEAEVPVEGFLTKEAKRSHQRIDELYSQMAALLGGMDMTPAPASPKLDKKGNFFDADRPVMDLYYEIVSEKPTPQSRGQLRALIDEDPDFYDSYGALADLLGPTEGRPLRRTAYERAVARLAPDGTWPRRIDWGFLENRHILRALLNEAIACWAENPAEAAEIFQRLLAVCPDDNVGARYYLLAIRENLSFNAFEKRFGSEYGYNAAPLDHWFDANVSKYPADFASWQREVEE